MAAAARKSTKASSSFSELELAAMKDKIEEEKAARRKGGKQDGEADLLGRIAEMEPADRALAERIHAIVTTNAPSLACKTWYGMPAYADKDGKVICFFQSAAKFRARYATFGFNEAARLDDGNIWPTAFALTRLSPADEERLGALVKKAVA